MSESDGPKIKSIYDVLFGFVSVGFRKKRHTKSPKISTSKIVTSKKSRKVDYNTDDYDYDSVRNFSVNTKNPLKINLPKLSNTKPCNCLIKEYTKRDREIKREIIKKEKERKLQLEKERNNVPQYQINMKKLPRGFLFDYAYDQGFPVTVDMDRAKLIKVIEESIK